MDDFDRENEPITPDMEHEIANTAARLHETEGLSSVCIIATRFDPKTGKTQVQATQFGNWYATYGAVANWLRAQNRRLDLEQGHNIF